MRLVSTSSVLIHLGGGKTMQNWGEISVKNVVLFRTIGSKVRFGKSTVTQLPGL